MAACLAALLASGCGGDAAAGGPGGPPPPALVELAPGRTGVLRLERTYLGQVRSEARAELAAETSGAILEVLVREGDRVEAGQVLARIDPDLARAELSAARAADLRTQTQEAQARADAQRFSRAGATTVAAVEIDRAQAQADALAAERDGVRAQVSRARASLGRHRVLAPFAGVIAARHVDPGSWAAAGTVLLELVADERTEVLVRVEPELLEDVDTGTVATLRSSGHEAPAQVLGVVRALDPGTRTAQVRLRADPSPPWLLAGSAVDVRFVLEHEGEGIIVPRDALVPGVSGTRVVRVVDGAAQPVPVEVIERSADEARVVGEGLAASDRFVVRGNDRLRPGQPVREAERGGSEEREGERARGGSRRDG